METKNKELYSLHFLRCIAVILITWDHLLPGMYLENTGAIPVTFVDRYILWPLSIINYFGFYGVVIFFLISGYAGLLAYDHKQSSVGNFLLKRIFRIIPPVLASAAAYYLVFFIVHKGFLADQLHLSLLPYLQANGALWTLKIEILFYFLFAALIPVFKKDLLIGTAAGTLIVALGSEAGVHWQYLIDFSEACSYCFYILFGAYLYLIRETENKTKLHVLFKIILLPLLWYLIVHYNIVIYNPERYETGNSYGVSFLYAALTFLAFVASEDRIPKWISAKRISQYSYPVYLNQVPMRAIFAPLFALGMPTPLLSALAFVFTILFSWIYLKYIDGLFQGLYKKITNLGGQKK